MTPCLANSVPDVLGSALEPKTKPPPKIQNITGSLAPGVAEAGRQMLRNRQFSDGARSADAAGDRRALGAGVVAERDGGGTKRPCMQSAPNSVAGRIPLHRTSGWGGRHRKSSTGGAAKGMPLYDATPPSTNPCNSPVSTRTTEGCCAAVVTPLPRTPARKSAGAWSPSKPSPRHFHFLRFLRARHYSCENIRSESHRGGSTILPIHCLFLLAANKSLRCPERTASLGRKVEGARNGKNKE